MTKVNWRDSPKDSNFEAARGFLTLTLGHKDAEELVKKLRKAEISKFPAKDILRAAQLAALPTDIEHVAANLDKITNNQEISPVLLCHVRDKPLIIADGMHRVSALWHLAEDSPVHALEVEL